MITIVNSRPHAARIAGAVLGLAALIAAMVFTATPASAHARLEVTSPKDGSSLTATPPEVMLRFNEPIQKDLSQVTVTTGSKDATSGKIQIEGNSVYQPLKSSLKPGSYKIVYKVVSADGHPISGTFSFSYDPPEGDSGAGADPSATTPSATSGSATPTQEPSSSSAPATDPSSTTAPSDSPSTTAPSDSPSTTAPSDSSSTTGPPDGETAPEEPGDDSTTTSPDADADAQEDDNSDEGTSGWLWVGVATALIVLAAIGLLIVRSRKGRGGRDDEEIPLDDDYK